MRLSRDMDRDDLARYLSTEVAGLSEAREKKRYIDAAFILRNWLSPRLSYPPEDSLLLLHWEYKLPELLWMLQEGMGGVWCGGCAHIFSRLLDLVGIPAAVFMYGAEMLSHETTVFGVPDTDIKYYVLDSYLNFHYVHAQAGGILSLEELLRLVKNKQYGQIRRADSRITRGLVLKDTQPAHASWAYPGGAIPTEPIRTYGSHRLYPGAVLSMDTLLAGGAYRQLLDKARRNQPIDEFMLDMMLVRPQFSKVANAPEAFPDICLLRGVIAALAEEPEWAAGQEAANWQR